MSLLKSVTEQKLNELAPNGLAKADGSDAGKTDIEQKIPVADVKFSLMRNTINADGKVTGGAVNDYLERAVDLNNEVDSVVYGLETDDGEVVKVYVNAQEAEAFEAEMKKMLGMEDDIEEVVNDLAARFDIIDVVWPKGSEQSGGPGNPEEGDEELDLGDDSGGNGEEEPSGEGEEDEDEMEVIASADDEPAVDDDESEAEPAEGEPATDVEPDAEADGETDDKKDPKKKAKGDKHAKLSDVGKKLKGVQEDQLQANSADTNGVTMTIGNKFLQRVLSEARGSQEDADGFRDEFDIPGLSPSSPAVANLPFPLAKAVVQIYQLFGLSADTLEMRPKAVRDGALEFANTLRTNLTMKKAAIRLHDALAEAMGYTRKDKAVTEKAAMPSMSQDEITLMGSKTMAQMEEMLLKMGLPSMVIKRAMRNDREAMMKAALLLQKGIVKTRFTALAQELGVNLADVKAGDKAVAEGVVAEAIDPMGADMYADAVMALVAALGVPDAAFARNARAILAKEFRDARKSANLNALTGRVKTFTAQFQKMKSQVSRGEE